LTYSLADIAANEIHHYDAHGWSIAVPSCPAEVTLTIVIFIIDHAHTMSAAVTSACGNTFRREVTPDGRYEIVMANTLIRTNALAVSAIPFADWLAEAGVSQCETVAACATIWRGACAVDALFSADRRAMTVRVCRVTVVTGASFRRGAPAVTAARLADRIADVSGFTQPCVTGVAVAALRRYAGAHHAWLAADRLARARVRCPVTLVAGAYVGCDTRAVAAVRLADRFADVSGDAEETVTRFAVAGFRRRAGAHHAWLAADRLAHARVHLPVTVVAGADPGSRALAESATLVAFWAAGETRIGLVAFVTVLAAANVGRRAMAIRARAIADRLASARIRAEFVRLDFYVTGTAEANVRFGAVSVIPLAFYVTHGTARESIRIHPVTVVAAADLHVDAGAVDATVCAHRRAQFSAIRHVA